MARKRGSRTKPVSTREKFPARPPAVISKSGKIITPKRTVQKPDRTLTRIRQDANLE